VRAPFGWCHGLDVPVHRDANVSVTHQFLHCFHISTALFFLPPIVKKDQTLPSELNLGGEPVFFGSSRLRLRNAISS
jgi:hypothetical protein